MKNIVFCALFVLVAFTFVDSAEAQAACFDWTCNTGTGQCDFDGSCSDNTPLDYRWTWGDGSPTQATWPNPPDPLATHTYASPTSSSYVTLSVGYLFIGYYQVTCRIQIRNQIGPPVATFSGTCS